MRIEKPNVGVLSCEGPQPPTPYWNDGSNTNVKFILTVVFFSDRLNLCPDVPRSLASFDLGQSLRCSLHMIHFSSQSRLSQQLAPGNCWKGALLARLNGSGKGLSKIAEKTLAE